MGNSQSSLQYRQTKLYIPTERRTQALISSTKQDKATSCSKAKQRQSIYNKFSMSSAGILILYLKHRAEYKLYEHDFYPNIVIQQVNNTQKQSLQAPSSQYSQSQLSKIAVNQDEYPYNCMGIIYGTSEAGDIIGTGFLISQNLILTSASLITQQNGLPIQNIRFYPKVGKNLKKSQTLQIQVTDIRISKNFIKSLKSKEDISKYNFALLMIKQSIYRDKYIKIGYDLKKQKQAQIFGYCFELIELNIKQKNIKTINKKGKITRINDDILYHNIKINKHSDGSPILIQFIQGYIFAVGICSPFRGSQKQQKYACNLTHQKIKIIKQWAEQLKGKSSEILSVKMINISYNHHIHTKSHEQKNQSLQNQIKQLENTIASSLLHQKSQINQFLMAKLGQLYFIKGEYAKSIEILQNGLELSEQLYGRQSLQSALFYNGLGLSYDKLKKYQQALQHFQIYLKIYQNKYGQQCKGVATAYNNIGNLLRKQKMTTKSLEYYQKSLKIIYKLEGQRSCSVALLLANMAIILWQHKKYLQAIKKYKKALDIYHHFEGKVDLEVSRTLYNLSLCYYDIEQYELWIQRVDQSFAILRSLKMENHHCFNKRKVQFIQKLKKILTKASFKSTILLNIMKTLKQSIKAVKGQEIILLLDQQIAENQKMIQNKFNIE